MSNERLVILEFKYLHRTKHSRNKLQKVLEKGRVIKLTDCFHFTQITEKNSQFPLQKLAIFNIYHVFGPFAKLPGSSRFLHFFSQCDVRNEAVFLLLEHSSLLLSVYCNYLCFLLPSSNINGRVISFLWTQKSTNFKCHKCDSFTSYIACVTVRKPVRISLATANEAYFKTLF